MTVKATDRLYDLIFDSYDGTDPLVFLKNTIGCELFEPRIFQLHNIERAIKLAHHTPDEDGEPETPHLSIKYNRQIYFSYTGFESAIDLKPEYTQQMDTWIQGSDELSGLIFITVDYIADLFETAVCMQNLEKLLPSFIYSVVLKSLNEESDYPPEFFGTKPDLTDKDIAAFQDKYSDLISELKVIYLDKLTGASCPSKQKILLI